MIFENPAKFSEYIETKSIDNNMSIIDAIVEYCEENYVDPKEISTMITKSLKDKLEMEFIDLNYLPKHSTLFFDYE